MNTQDRPYEQIIAELKTYICIQQDAPNIEEDILPEDYIEIIAFDWEEAEILAARKGYKVGGVWLEPITTYLPLH